jgi:hypothetical protein
VKRETGHKQLCLSRAVTEYGFLRSQERQRMCGCSRAYASPSVSNIAALIASGALFPAQTTNWNAG